MIVLGALPSQKYDVVLLAFAKWYNVKQGHLENKITEEMVKDFLRKCDKLEIEI